MTEVKYRIGDVVVYNVDGVFFSPIITKESIESGLIEYWKNNGYRPKVVYNVKDHNPL